MPTRAPRSLDAARTGKSIAIETTGLMATKCASHLKQHEVDLRFFWRNQKRIEQHALRHIVIHLTFSVDMLGRLPHVDLARYCAKSALEFSTKMRSSRCFER